MNREPAVETPRGEPLAAVRVGGVGAAAREDLVRLLADAAAILIGARDAAAALSELFALVSERLPVDASFHFVLAPDGETLDLEFCAGVVREQAAAATPLRLGQGVCGRVAASKARFVVEDVQSSDDPATGLIRSMGVRSYACHPLTVGDRLLGTLSFGSRTRDAFDAAELDALRTICSYVAMARERLRLERDLRERADGLAKSRERLARAQKAARVGTWDWDLASGAIEWSDGIYDLLGLEPGAVTPSFERWAERIHPDDLAPVLARFRAAVEGTADRFADEFRVRNASGEWRWLASSCAIERDAAGKAARLLGSNYDVTERRQTEDALRRTAGSLALAMRGGRMGWWSRDLATNRVVWSAELEELFGLPPGGFEARGGDERTFFEFVHPEDRGPFATEVAAAVEQGRDYAAEFRFRRADDPAAPDAWRWMDGRGRATYDAEGRPTMLFGLGIDVTERKRAERGLAEARSELQLVADTMPAAVARCSKDLRFLWVNRRYAERFGEEPAGLAGRALADVLGPAAMEVIRPYVVRVLAGDSVEYEAVIPFAGVEPRWTHVAYTPTRDAAGAVDGWVAHVTDVHARRLGEEMLEAQRRSLEMLAGDEPLPLILAHLARSADAQYADGAAAAILLLHDDGTLTHGAAPGLPDDYTHAIDGIRADAAVGTCCSAAATGCVVVTPDLDAAPGWEGLSHLPRALGFEAAWSQPILAPDGRVLGTFGTYFRQRREPTPRERRVVEVLARTAGVAIERRRAEAALRASEARFRQLADAMPQVVWTARADGSVDYYNARVALYHGADRDAATGLWTWAGIVHADDLGATAAAWARAVESGEPYQMEHRLRMADGSYRWHVSRAAPARAEGGRVDRWFGTATDVHELKAAQASIAESGRQFRDLAENIAQLAWTARPDGHIDWYNRRWYEYTGTTPAEMEGWGWQRVHDARTLPSVLDRWKASLATGQSFEMEFPLRGADGVLRPFLTRAQPVLDAQGRVVRWFGTNTDVSAQREAERTLAEHRERLEALVEERTRELESSHDALRKAERLAALGTLAQGLAHDLNNLLLPLRIRVQTLADEPTLSAAGREDVAEIRGVADYLANLTRGLRLFARDPAVADRAPPGAATDLASWFLDARTFLKATLPLGVALEADVPAGLPRVRVGQHALSQAVLNLVHNAGDAVAARVRAGADGRHGIVELAARARPDGRVEVLVRDNGTGMSPEVRRRAMEPFFTTKPRGQGTGLGLAMVHGVVTSAGGDVLIESAEDEGTTITLVFPVVADAAAAPLPVPPSATIAAPVVAPLGE